MTHEPAIPVHDASGSAPAVVAADSQLHHQIGRLAGVLGSDHFPGADRAALKRMVPGVSPPLAFYRLWLRHLDDTVPAPDQTPAWTVIVAGLAACSPQAHRPGRSFGQALAESGWHEARLERLLAVDEASQLTKLAADALRFLAAHREAFDWTHVMRLLLARDEHAREAIHRRIATDFYRHQPRTDTKE